MKTYPSTSTGAILLFALLLLHSSFPLRGTLSFSSRPIPNHGQNSAQQHITTPNTPNTSNNPAALLSSPSTKKNKKKKEQNFHKILERVGKTVFRPGGSRATRILQDEWCCCSDFVGDDNTAAAPPSLLERQTKAGSSSSSRPPMRMIKVIELAAGVGTAGIEWAARRSNCHVTVTDLDASRMEIAKMTAKKRGLSDQIDTSVQDMFHLNFINNNNNNDIDDGADTDKSNSKIYFDVAMIEAALTHFPRQKKLSFLSGDIRDYANEILLHEICLRGDAAASVHAASTVKCDIGKAVAIGFSPETEDDWKSIVEEAGWRVTHIQTGPMRLLNPGALLEEEGIRGVARMIWNLVIHEDLRERVLSTRSILESHQDDIGYVILRAVKQDDDNKQEQ